MLTSCYCFAEDAPFGLNWPLSILSSSEVVYADRRVEARAKFLGDPQWWIGRKKMTKAVFFDVDFTLIYPGPTFDGDGYRRFCERHGVSVNPSCFEQAVAHASALLDQTQEDVYNPELFVEYARKVIEQMGGRGQGLDACAREIYEEWARCQHFLLYEDVLPVLRQLNSLGLSVGLISNTHRCLTSFEDHFQLNGLITSRVSSLQHGWVKPHPSIFKAALKLVRVDASDAVMVGDSVKQDINGAHQVGMRAILLARAGVPSESVDGVPIIRSLTELLAYL